MRFNVHIPLAALLVLWAQPCLPQARPAQANIINVEIERLGSDKGQVPRTVRKRPYRRPLQSQTIGQVANFPKSSLECMPYRYFTMRIPTES